LTFFARHIGCYVRDRDLFTFFDVPYGSENEGEAFKIPFPSGIRAAAMERREGYE